MVYVARLGTTPIKGFALQEPPSVFLTTDTGVAGDRVFFLMDATGKLMSATRTDCFLQYWAVFDPASEVLAIGCGTETLIEDEVVAGGHVEAHFFADRHASGRLVQGRWSAILSEIAGQQVQLVRATGPLGGFDVHPVSLLAGASIRALTPYPHDHVLDNRRFRMTITVEGVPPFTEDTWLGQRLHVGGAVIRPTTPVVRCAAVQKDPDGGAQRDGNPLRRIKEVRGTATTAHGRGLHLGVYAEVEQSGSVRLGDPVRRAA